jgi:hypothetical protein
MTPAVKDIVNRRPVWLALSVFFLDTEMQPYTHSHIARVLSESPYSLREVETILYREVYPVCCSNLGTVAGVWGGFDHDWLESSILQQIQRAWSLARNIQPRRWMIRDDWIQVIELIANKPEVHQP